VPAGTDQGSTYNPDMPIESRCALLALKPWMAPVALLVLLAAVAPPSRAENGVGELRAVVDEACRCAAQQRDGIGAAVRCTGGPEAFGRLKVARRDAWDEAAQRIAARLERVIEACIANAEDADAARARLGLAPLRDDGTPAAVWWQPVPAADLGAHPRKLVRLRLAGAREATGVVESLAGGALLLRRARRDGGGRERIPLDVIESAWVMRLPGP